MLNNPNEQMDRLAKVFLSDEITEKVISAKVCPRCNTTMNDTYPGATSRRDNKTEICSSCGTEEALIDCGAMRIDQRELDFVEKLGL